VVQNLSDRSWSSATNGWEPVERDTSLGEDLADDGTTITLNGVLYPKGLGVAPDSTIVYDLDGACTRFAADIGVDDEITGYRASVIFTVVGDSTTLYTSGTMTPSSATTSVSLDVTGVNHLALTVDDAGDGPGEDLIAYWAGARVTCAAGSGGTFRTITYSYDGLQRLTGAVESGATTNTYAYGYDNAGNRTSVTANGVTTSTSYNAANQVSGWSYDAAGNLTSDGTTTNTWDALNRLTVQGTTNNAYNGDGVLVGQIVGSTAITYTQDLASPLSQILSDGTNQYIYGADRLFGVAGGTRTWYLSDALGSVRQTFDDAGFVQQALRYDAWGVPQGSSIAPFGYTGELQQGNQVYLRARWYNAGSGAFGSRDSFAGMAEIPYSLHYFQYGYANPVLNTDPSGKCAVRDWDNWRNGKCDTIKSRLADHGMIFPDQLDYLEGWTLSELEAVMAAVEAFKTVVPEPDWSREDFK